MLMINWPYIRTLSLPGGTSRRAHASSAAAVGKCKVGLQKIEKDTKDGFRSTVIHIKTSLSSDSEDSLQVDGYPISAVAAEEVVCDTPAKKYYSPTIRIWPESSDVESDSAKLIEIQANGRKKVSAVHVMSKTLSPCLWSSRSLVTFANGTMGHQESPTMLLDVNDSEGVSLEEACFEATSQSGQSNPDFCLLSHGEMFDDEETDCEVVTFQVKSNKLTYVQNTNKRSFQLGGVIEPLSKNVKKRRIISSTTSLLSNKREATFDQHENNVEWMEEPSKGGDCFFGCFMCSFTGERENDIVKHWKKEHMNNQPYACCYCHSMFSQSYRVQTHIEQCHPGLEVAILLKPSAVFANRLVVTLESADDAPMVLYDTNKEEVPPLLLAGDDSPNAPETSSNFDCSECGYTFSSAAAHCRHKRLMHSVENSHTCYVCGEKFSNISDARRHIELCHVSASKKSGNGFDQQSSRFISVYVCKACAYRTNDKSSMTRHIKYVHSSCRPYACPYCSYSAVECPKLRMHVAGHHRGLPQTVIKRLNALKNFQSTVKELRKKLTIVLKEDVSVKDRRKGVCGNSDLLIVPLPFDESLPPKRRANDDRLAPPSLVTNNGVPTVRGGNSQCNGNVDLDAWTTEVGFSITSDGLLKCNQCDFSISKWSGLVAHVRIAHLDYYFQKQRDNDNSRTKKNISSAAEEDAANNWPFSVNHYQCQLCPYRSLHRGSVVRHIFNTHMRAIPFKCPYCDYSHVDERQVVIHISAAHAGKHSYVQTDPTLLAFLSKQFCELYKRVLVDDDAEVSGNIEGTTNEQEDFVDNSDSGDPSKAAALQLPYRSWDQQLYHFPMPLPLHADSSADDQLSAEISNDDVLPRKIGVCFFTNVKVECPEEEDSSGNSSGNSSGRVEMSSVSSNGANITNRADQSIEASCTSLATPSNSAETSANCGPGVLVVPVSVNGDQALCHVFTCNV